MACAYCGKEVPFRMRLTGEDHFCCPAHKRLYHDEHSRIGLARLLEEVSADPEDAAETPSESVVSDETKVDEKPPAEALPEPDPVYSGQGLKLWTFPHQPHSFKPRFEQFALSGETPAEYIAGSAAPPKQEKNQAAPPAPSRPEPDAALSVVEPPPRSSENVSGAESKTTAKNSRAGDEDDPASEVKKVPVPDQAAADETEERPVFQVAAEPKASGGYKVAAGVVLALCLGAGGYLGLGIGGGGKTNVATTAAAESVLDEWIPDWSETELDGGIALFGPSQEWSDYRVQWKAESEKDLAWVFRAADSRNYYAVQIQRADSGDLLLVRYAVVGGTRSDLVESALTAPGPEGRNLAVELEVVGSRFVLFLEGRNVAEWSDDRLPSGGFGVVRPDVGLAEVDDVKVTRLSGHSAKNERFWKGLPPDTLPEVTALPPVHKSSQESEEL